MASTRSSSQLLWTISIISRRCYASQSSYPREIFLHPMLLLRLSGSTCLFIAWIKRSTFAAGASSATRCCRLLPSTSRVLFSLVSAMAQYRGSTTSFFILLPSTSFATSLKSTAGRSSRCSWKAMRATTAVHGIANGIAGLLATASLIVMAIVAALKLVVPATRTLAVIARPLQRTVSSKSRAICMALTASILMTSAVRTQRIKHAQTTTTTALINAPMTCTTMMAATLLAMRSSLSLA